MLITEFPPLYTKQPNQQTWEAQKRHWESIIIEYCKKNNVWRVNPGSEVFSNPRIQRTLRENVAIEVLEYLVQQNRAEWLSKNDECLVLWRTPTQVADLILKWVESTGHGGIVLTTYELTEGESIPELAGVDEAVLTKALQDMQKRGNAAVIEENGKILGVKIS